MSILKKIRKNNIYYPGMNILLLVISIFFNTDLAFSQAKEYINGKIINSTTKNPVQFATVKLKKNQLGVYANADGDFRIASNPDFRNDSIIITCIGYKRKAISYNDLDRNSVNNILLDQSVYGHWLQ